MNRADWGGADFRDVMAGVDYLVAQKIADPARLGIGGWSYGGYMAEWAITQTNRFKAAVSGAGMANLASEFGTEAGSSGDQWFFGVPYENLDTFMKSSPVKYLKNARTPTLILQGEADRTDPLGQSQELYRGLKYYGVEAELVLYPREGHGLTAEVKPTGMLGPASVNGCTMSSVRRWKRLISPHGVFQVPKSAASLSDAADRDRSSCAGVALPAI